jgi:protein-tyrosine phosphatase
MIDIHCHILPELDDGASSLEESIKMAMKAEEQGITDIIATPHVILDTKDKPTPEAIVEKVQLVNGELECRNILVKVHPGAEIFIDPAIPSLIDTNRVFTLVNAGKYVIIELPLGGMPSHVRSTIFELTTRGITPIIAHPERNRKVADDPNELLDLIHMGCLSQANAGSFLGIFGSSSKRAAEILLDHNMVHFIGSDAHNSTSRRIDLSMVKVPSYLLTTNPKKVLLGQAIEPGEPIRYKKRGFFSFLFK